MRLYNMLCDIFYVDDIIAWHIGDVAVWCTGDAVVFFIRNVIWNSVWRIDDTNAWHNSDNGVTQWQRCNIYNI